MARASGYYYSKPQVGDKCLFVYALNLWRDTEYVDDNWIYPTVSKGTILSISNEEVVEWREDPIFEFRVLWESGDEAGLTTEEYSTTYVIVRNQDELDKFLAETKTEAVDKMEIELNRRKEEFNKYAGDVQKMMTPTLAVP